MVLAQNCFFLQTNSKSKTALLGFTVPACFPHSSISHGQDFCACFPSFHLPYCEFFHAVILEFSTAAHPTSLICSFPESLHLISSPRSSKPPGMCFSPKYHLHWLQFGDTHAGTGLAEHPPGLEVWRQLLPQAQKVLPAFLVGCSRCSLDASVHPLISPANGGGASYSFFLLHCLLKHLRADLRCVFPEHFLRLGTNFSLSLSQTVS